MSTKNVEQHAIEEVEGEEGSQEVGRIQEEREEGSGEGKGRGEKEKEGDKLQEEERPQRKRKSLQFDQAISLLLVN